MAGAVRNSNKVSWRNILTADDVHMLEWLSVAVETETQKITLSGSFKMTTKRQMVELKLLFLIIIVVMVLELMV